jgi:hypothetical protein
VNLTTIAIALAVIAFLLAKRIRGEAVPAPRKLFVLPVVIGIIGLQNISHARMNAVDVTVVAVGAVMSLGLGALRGRVDKVALVGGSPFMSWSAASVAVFAVNIVAKLALDAGGVAAGGTSAALSSSILLSLGLTLLGESAVVFLRTQAPSFGAAPSDDRYRGAVHGSEGPTIWPPSR